MPQHHTNNLTKQVPSLTRGEGQGEGTCDNESSEPSTSRRSSSHYLYKKWWAAPTLLLSCLLAAFSFTPSAVWSHVDSDIMVDVVQSALQPDFTPPPPGTYSLPPIDTINDHQLVDSTGKPVDLFALTAGKIAVISFMYTSCHDVGGCPLAAAVLQQVDQLLEKRPELAKQVTLLSMSFDVERDRPAHLAEIREGLAPRTAWHFLTSVNQENLQTVLEDFNQPVAKLWKEDGSWSGLFRHVLKVYLLDARHQVRNIYSTGLFSAQLVMNDIETLLLETQNHTATDRRP